MQEDNNRKIIEAINASREVTEVPENELLKEISAFLKDIKNNQQNIIEFEKEKRVQDLKEKVSDEPTDTEPVKEPDDDSKKEMNFLRNQFEKSFGGIKDLLKPGNLLKSAGLLTGSPLFMLMGDKLNDLLDSYNEHKENVKSANDESLDLQKQQQQTSFLNEAMQDEEINRQEETRDLLQQIADNTDDIIDNTKPEKKSPLEFLKAPLAALQNFLPAGIATAFAKIPGLKGLAGLGSKLGGKGLLSLLGKGGRLLGKAAGPLALLFGGIDFAKGFGEAKEITGREDFGSKVQAGLAKALSGFTFGLIDPKMISASIDEVFQRLIGFFMAPFEAIKGALEGRKPISDIISEYFSKLTFGLFSPEFIENSLNLLTQKIKDIFGEPFNVLMGLVDQTKEQINEEINSIMNIGKSIIDSINSTFDSITDSITNFIQNIIGAITDRIDSLKEKIAGTIDLVKSPFKKLKSFFSDDDEDIEIERETRQKFFKITNEVNTTNNRINEDLKTIQRENLVLQKIKEEKIKKQAADIEKKSAGTNKRASQQNLLNNNIFNNIYPSEDMSTKTDDRTWGLMGAGF